MEFFKKLIELIYTMNCANITDTISGNNYQMLLIVLGHYLKNLCVSDLERFAVINFPSKPYSPI